MSLDTASLLPGRHVTAQLICLARFVVGRDHGQPHHLLLKERDAERLLENRHQTLVWIVDGFEALSAPRTLGSRRTM